ncbi:hypothetical protein ACIBKZ_22430 [Streptomyces sp. NPDC050421]|uniref:hypothetical protein n=1 Tax=Streptomyces sp. NPDC050421 TaxID=3365613 RepID=UPI0037AD3938
MTIRLDIANLLRAGHTQTEIMATLHVGTRAITNTRRALQLPGQRPGKKPLPSLEQALRERVTITDGCWLWAGPSTYPMVNHRSTRITGRRAAFLIRQGRAPVGKVMPSCDRQDCVAPDHMDDQPMRNQLKAQMASIFGGTA